jgi:hypothetical protein
MTPAARAELLDHELLGLSLFVLARRIVAALATVTLKTNQISHGFYPTLIASGTLLVQIGGAARNSAVG